MAKKLASPQFTDAELNEEINRRADALTNERVDSFLNSNVVIRHPFSRVAVQVHFDHENDPSMTHQSHKESCDINNIIRQFDRSGILPPPTKQARYEDVSELNNDLTNLMQRADAAYQAVVEKQAAIARAKEKLETSVDSGNKSREITPSSSTSPADPATPAPIATQP